MIDQGKLDREYVEGLEKQIEQLGTRLVTTQRDLARYREENLELEDLLEQADREIGRLQTLNVALLGGIEQAKEILNRTVWTPRRHGAEAE